MIEKLISFFKLSKDETENKVPDGVCPTCWGHQEYDSKIRKLYQDKQIDVNNHEANHAFIQKFVVENIRGIQLVRDNNMMRCPKCNKQY